MYDWSKFIFEKGNLFEDHYIDYLKEYGEVVKVGDFTSARNIEKASETVEAMENQTEIITQGVLRNPENQTYGLADLLIRLDVLLEAKEIFPNILGVLVVTLSFRIPVAILAESTLSFIGLGIAPPASSWGTLASDGWTAIKFYPHLILFPSLAIFFTILSFLLFYLLH